MKQTLVALLCLAVTSTAYAGGENKFQNLDYSQTTQHLTAVVTAKKPVMHTGLVKSITRCDYREVPVYSNTGGEILGSLFGLLLGGAIGNKVGGDGGAVAGALIGGVAGNSMSKDQNAQRTVIGTKREKYCTSVPVRGDTDVGRQLGWIYYLKDMQGRSLPPIGSTNNPSQKNYFVGQHLRIRIGQVVVD